jgi:hypothetical protein
MEALMAKVIKYLIWEKAEVAVCRGKVWRCFCGDKEDCQENMELHLELDHKIVKTTYEEAEK